ncbi:AzlD family protein [Rhizobium sp. SAFR-030]|uniref:AzlD family protein n=1 Tax=Rhizobium sp. SAFR-030 TaxID=3387277 RepID=UPI003F818087
MSDLQLTLIILAAGLATYLTRIGGFWLISSMRSIPPRMETALNAVPAAVLTTLVAPSFFNGGWDVKIAMLAALLLGLRHPGLPLLATGWGVAMLLRHLVLV